ncbi:MAG: hypothetical protein ACRDF0_06910 [Candidatus Limnocylindria bacterium]
MSQPETFSDLSPREVDALRAAATWYAKYRATDVSERAGDRSAAAMVERDEYLDLISALRKLGVRVRVPDSLVDRLEAVA